MAARAADSLLAAESVSLGFGGLTVLNNVSLAVRPGERVAVIGPNGAGKTSLLNCINGFYHPDSGHIRYRGRDITRAAPYEIARLGMGRTFQNIELFTGATVLDNLLLARHRHIRYGLLAAALYYGRAQAEETTHRMRVEEVIDFLELEPIRHAIVGGLPYGRRKRVELGRALATDPELLLLDEPMAGMTIEEKQDMVRFIVDANESLGITVVLIEHDMGVVMDVAQQVFVLDFGALIGEGTPAEIRANPHVVRAYLGDEVAS
ncbi:MAG TPA: ABC transporter ATP-binding protein [bacterium]|nr:ABC transporter ATP-binding protein [bacterium]